MRIFFALISIWTVASATDLKLHIMIFEIPAIQETVQRWEEKGVPMIKIKGCDASFYCQEEGMAYQSPLIQREVKGTTDYLRLKYPDTPLHEGLAINCVFNEQDIIFDLDRNTEVNKQIDLSEGNSLTLRIKLKKVVGPSEMLLRIRLATNRKGKRREFADCGYVWDTSKQLYIGYPSHLGKGKRGNIYFVTLFNERVTN